MLNSLPRLTNSERNYLKHLQAKRPMRENAETVDSMEDAHLLFELIIMHSQLKSLLDSINISLK